MQQDNNPFASPQSQVDPLVAERPFVSQFPAEMRKVRTGLSLVYFGICGVLLTAIAFPLIIAGTERSNPESSVMLTGAMGVLIVGLTILMFVGQVLCMAVPQESGAKGLVTASVVMQAIAVAGALSTLVIAAPVVASGVSGIGNLLSFAATLCFVLFLRKTAQYIQQEDIAMRAMRTLIVGLVSIVLVVIGAVGTVASVGVAPVGPNPGAAPSPLFFVPMAIGGIAGLVAVIMYANTITYLRKAIKA